MPISKEFSSLYGEETAADETRFMEEHDIEREEQQGTLTEAMLLHVDSREAARAATAKKQAAEMQLGPEYWRFQ